MASTSGENYWANFRDQLTGLAMDWGRSRLIDVETANDDRNMPDQADLRYGWFGGDGSGTVAAPGGIPIVGWLLLGGAVIAGAFLLKRVR